MPKFRVLSGPDVLKILSHFNFHPTEQHGSHIKLKRIIGHEIHVLIVPNHREIARGTLKAIYAQASHFVSEEELRGHFYTE